MKSICIKAYEQSINCKILRRAHDILVSPARINRPITNSKICNEL